MALTTLHKVALLVALPVTGILLYLLLTKTSDEEDEEEEKKEKVVTSRQTVIEVRVPRECIGAIIGAQGSRIKQLQESTRTRINCKDENPGDTERVMVVRGTAEGAQQAEHLIRKLVAEQPKIYTEEILIPQQATGRIIGKSGDTVRYMSHVSHCKINVDRSNEKRTDGMKRVVLRGTFEAVENAKGLIQEKLAEEEAFRARSAVLAANRQERGSTRRKDGSPAIENSQLEQSAEAVPTEAVPQQNGGSPSHRPLGVCAPLQQSGASQEAEWPTHLDYLEVYISAVESPSRFWVQLLSSKSAQLDRLVEEMSRFYGSSSTNQESIEEVKVGDLIGARFPHDESWYRARVCEIADDTLDLYYVDFGDNAWIPKNQIRSLRGDFLILPFQAFECCLANVKPNSDDWSEESTDLFEDLTYTAKWKVIMAKTISYHQTERGPIPCVDLIDTNKEKDINVVQELVKAGFGVSVAEDNLVAEDPSVEPLKKTASPHATNVVACHRGEPAVSHSQVRDACSQHHENAPSHPLHTYDNIQDSSILKKAPRRRKKKRKVETKNVDSDDGDDDDANGDVSHARADRISIMHNSQRQAPVEEDIEAEAAVDVFASQKVITQSPRPSDDSEAKMPVVDHDVIDITGVCGEDPSLCHPQPHQFSSRDISQKADAMVTSLEPTTCDPSLFSEENSLQESEHISSKYTSDTFCDGMEDEIKAEVTSSVQCAPPQELLGVAPRPLSEACEKGKADPHIRPESGIFTDDTVMVPSPGCHVRNVRDSSLNNIQAELDTRPESGIFSDDSANDAADNEEAVLPVSRTSEIRPEAAASASTSEDSQTKIPSCNSHLPCKPSVEETEDSFHQSEGDDVDSSDIVVESVVDVGARSPLPPSLGTPSEGDSGDLATASKSITAEISTSSPGEKNTDDTTVVNNAEASSVATQLIDDAPSEDSEIDILRIESLSVSDSCSLPSLSPNLDHLPKQLDASQLVHDMGGELLPDTQLLASFPESSVPLLSSLASDVCLLTKDSDSSSAVLAEVDSSPHESSANSEIASDQKLLHAAALPDDQCTVDAHRSASDGLDSVNVPASCSEPISCDTEIQSGEREAASEDKEDSDLDVLTVEDKRADDGAVESPVPSTESTQMIGSMPVSELPVRKGEAAFEYSDSDSEEESLTEQAGDIVSRSDQSVNEQPVALSTVTPEESGVNEASESMPDRPVEPECELSEADPSSTLHPVTNAADAAADVEGESNSCDKDVEVSESAAAVASDEECPSNVREARVADQIDASEEDMNITADSLASDHHQRQAKQQSSSSTSSTADDDEDHEASYVRGTGHSDEEDHQAVASTQNQLTGVDDKLSHIATDEKDSLDEALSPPENVQELKSDVTRSPSNEDMPSIDGQSFNISNSDDEIIEVEDEYESLEPLVYDEDAFVVSHIPLDEQGLFYPEWLKSPVADKPPVKLNKWDTAADEQDDSLEISFSSHEGGYPEFADGADELNLPVRLERASSPFPCAERPSSPFPAGERPLSPFPCTERPVSPFPFTVPHQTDDAAGFEANTDSEGRLSERPVELGFESDFVPLSQPAVTHTGDGQSQGRKEITQTPSIHKMSSSADSDLDFTDFIDARILEKQESDTHPSAAQEKSGVAAHGDSSINISEDSLHESEVRCDVGQQLTSENKVPNSEHDKYSSSKDKTGDEVWVLPSSASNSENNGSIPESKFLHIKVDWPERHGIIELGSDDKLHSELASSTVSSEKYTEVICALEISPDSSLSKTAFTAKVDTEQSTSSPAVPKHKILKNDHQFELQNFDDTPPSKFGCVRRDEGDLNTHQTEAGEVGKEAGVVNVTRMPCLEVPTTEALSSCASTEMDSLEDGMTDSLEELKDEASQVKELRRSVVAALNQIREDEETRANYEDDDGELSCDSLDDVTEARDLRPNPMDNVDYPSQPPQSPSSMSQDSLCDSQTNVSQEEMTCLVEDDLPPRPTSSLDYYEDAPLEESSNFTDDSIEFDDSIFSGSQLDMTIFEMDTTPTREDDVFGPAPIMSSDFNIMMDARPVRCDVRPMQVIVEEEEEDDLSSCDSLEENTVKSSSASKPPERVRKSGSTNVTSNKSKKEYNYEEDSTAL